MRASLTLLFCLIAGLAAAQAPEPNRTANGDILDRYEKPSDQGIWGSILSSFGLGTFEKSYALVIGVSDFAGFSDLPTHKDPVRMREYLIEDAGFDTVITLTGTNATKQRIERLMINELSDAIGPNDRFLFYWSGHGITRERRGETRGYLPLASSGTDDFASMIEMRALARWDGDIEARQTLYLLDSCFSGLAGSAAKSDIRDLNAKQLMNPSRHILSAGTDGQVTIALDRLGGSVFTTAVLEGLREGRADTSNGQYGPDGLISVEELKQYVSTRVADIAIRARYPDPITPQLRDLGKSDGAFFFAAPEGRFGIRGARDAPAEDPGGPTTAMGGPSEPQVVAQPTAFAAGEIRIAQEKLAALGYKPGPPSGTYSAPFAQALIAFQQEQGLPATARLNDPTWVALLQVEPPQPKTFQECPACPTMVPIAGGDATLGTDSANHPEEGPPYTITLDPFAMAQTEITGAQWSAFVNNRPSDAQPADDATFELAEDCYWWDLKNASPARLRRDPSMRVRGGISKAPVECVSHMDALGYVKWLNTVTDGGYRLPTEAEIEYVLRAQTLPTDPNQACDLMNGALNVARLPGQRGPCQAAPQLIRPVASFEPNPLGIYDLYGNMWELSHNCWTARADAFETHVQFLDACASGTVTVRGASFDDPLENYRPTIRQHVPNIRRQQNIGFRVVKYPMPQ